MSENPLLHLSFAIPFDRIKPEHVEPAIRALILEAENELQAILGATPRTYANTLGALDHLGERLSQAFGVVSHLENVCTTPQLRAAYNTVVPLVTAFYTKLQLSEALYQALRDYSTTQEAQSLSPAKSRYLELMLNKFRREGAGLPPQQKERLEAIHTRLSELTNRFGQNVTDSTADYELYLEESQIAGLPQTALEAAQQSAASKGKRGYRFTLQAPSYLALMNHLDDPAIRKQVYLAYQSRATEEGRDNRPLIAEILALRQEKARLLGYDNFADYVLEDRMAKNATTAQSFEADLHARARPHFEREMQSLQDFRRQLEGQEAPPLQRWDIRYYVEKQRKALFDYDAEELRPYFALPNVLSGLFELCGRVFGIRVEEIVGEAVWHPEVRVYEIYQGEVRVARFYTDWFPRESKRGGAWANGLIVGERDGALEPHLGLNCGNLTPPVGTAPALLTPREVETVFHEFGHFLHIALSNVEVKSLAGTKVAWDFVELPSQIMENWVWERATLELIARHYQTGEALPEALFQKMQGSRNHWSAGDTMRQLWFGTQDLNLHVNYDPARENLLDYLEALQKEFSPTPLMESPIYITSFSHLFGSPVGYAAGYYSYKWSEVLDADAFTRFKREGLFNPQTGQDFIEHILSKGNSVDPADLFRGFMGRDPDPQALLVRSGLLG